MIWFKKKKSFTDVQQIPSGLARRRPGKGWTGQGWAGLWRGAAAGLAALAIGNAGAFAQTLPEFAVKQGVLVSPSAADAYYGSSTTHTNGDGHKTVIPEVDELAAAFDNDADLIYEYVRNRIRIVHQFGLTKGALGAVLDESGTAFDQAHLLVRLLRKAGHTAHYKYGTITLNAAQVADWFGVTNANAFRDLLADSGIPATVSGSTTVTSAVIAHIWVEATVGGQTRIFDPAYKPHVWKSGVNLASAMSFGGAADLISDLNSGSTSGTQNGAAYRQGINAASLNSQLQTYATNMLTNMRSNHADDELSDVIGGGDIIPAVKPANGYGTGSLAYTLNATRTWTGDIPDQYRTKVDLYLEEPSLAWNGSYFTVNMFADEVYGRRITVGTGMSQLTLTATIDHQVVGSWTDPYIGPGPYLRLRRTAEITVNHPYAADSGSYMDRTVYKSIRGNGVAVMVMGFGRASDRVGTLWSSEEATDPKYPDYCADPFCVLEKDKTPTGFTSRIQVAADYLGQFSDALDVHEQIADVRHTHHHTLGFVYLDDHISCSYVDGTLSPDCSGAHPAGMATRIDLETGLSVVSVNDNATVRKAAAHTAAALGSILEASIMEQVEDTADALTPQTKFEWQSEFLPLFKFFNFTSGNYASAKNLLGQGEGALYHSVSGFGSAYSDKIDNTIAPGTRARIQQYIDDGYTVVATQSVWTGPGDAKFINEGLGVWYPNLSRGAAFIAYKPDASSFAYVNITHDYNTSQLLKGGGDNASDDGLFDAMEVAGPLQDDFDDRSNLHGVSLHDGSLTYTAAPDMTVGAGEFPYSLSFQRTFTSGANHSRGFSKGWKHNWDITATPSGSGYEGLGRTSPLAAAGAIAGIYAIQSLYEAGTSLEHMLTGAMAQAWLRKSLSYNVVSISGAQGGGQYLRLADGTFLSPKGSTATLAQIGARGVNGGTPGTTPSLYTGRSYTYAHIDFTLTSAARDVMRFDGYQASGWFYDHDGFHQPRQMSGFRITDWDFPYGASVDFTYDNENHLMKVANNLGRELNFTYASNEALTGVDDGLGRNVTIATDGVTNPEGEQTKYEYLSPHSAPLATGERPVAYKMLTKVFAPDDHVNPAIRFDYDKRRKVSKVYDAIAATGARAPYEFRIVPGYRGARLDPVGNAYAVDYDEDGRAVAFTNEVGETVVAEYDNHNRVTKRTLPEGNYVTFVYDARHNVIEARRYDKNGADPITVSATYQAACDALTSFTDANGHTYDFTWNASTCKLTQQQQPAAAAGESRPVWSFAYNGKGQLTTQTDPLNNSLSRVFATNGTLTSSTIDPGGLNIATSFGYNTRGDLTSVNGPRTDVTDTSTITVDLMGRPLVGTDALGNKIERIYDTRGLETKVCAQTGSGSAPSCATATQTNQSYWAVTTTAYSDTGQPLSVTDPDNHTSYTYYDANDRPVVTVDAAGRKTRMVYDAAGRVSKVIRAWEGLNDGTGATLDCAAMRSGYDAAAGTVQQCYQFYTYTSNGQVETVTDANGNVTLYEYDAHDRLYRTYFPSKTTPGQHSTTDYEEYAYDANGNMTSKRVRSGQTITYYFDALNRMTDRRVPGAPSHTANGRTVTHDFTYDLAGRRTQANHQNRTVDYTYDAAGRVTSTSYLSGLRMVARDYDPAGNLTKLTYPQGFDVDFTYDALNRVTQAKDGARVLASIAYDRLSRRQSVSYANGASAQYAYTKRGDLTCHDWNLSGSAPASCNSGAPEIAYDFTYNGAGQLLTHAVWDAGLRWSPPSNTVDAYAANGLNQYASVTPGGGVAASIVHDARGNVTTDHRGRNYTYDRENVLRSVSLPVGSVSYIYHADGTRRNKTFYGGAPGLNLSYVYDGDQLIAEYYGAFLQRHHVRLPGSVDEAFLTIDYAQDGSITGGSCSPSSYASCERWLHHDRQGSVVATTDASGGIVDQYRYSPYGESGPEGDGGSALRFTGQYLDAETGLYYYKARFYDPEVGRFLQVDPIGYDDQQNLYAYVGNDTLNFFDPTGMCTGSRITNSDGSCKTTGGGSTSSSGVAEGMQRDRESTVVIVVINFSDSNSDNNTGSHCLFFCTIMHGGPVETPFGGEYNGQIFQLGLKGAAVSATAQSVLSGAGAGGARLLAGGRVLVNSTSIADQLGVAATISAGRQARHLAGSSSLRGGFVNSIDDAQTVLNQFHSGAAPVVGSTRRGYPIVRSPTIVGTNVNRGAGFPAQSTDRFIIKGTKNVSIVPTSPK